MHQAPIDESHAPGFSVGTPKDAGFSTLEMKAGGFSIAELKEAGYSTGELKVAGFFAGELKRSRGLRADIRESVPMPNMSWLPAATGAARRAAYGDGRLVDSRRQGRAF